MIKSLNLEASFMESKLEKLSRILKNRKKTKINYVVPDLWYLEELSISHNNLPSGEVLVNPYEFYSAVIDEYVLKNKLSSVNYNKSLSEALKVAPTNGNWIKNSVLYSAMVRTSSAWDHDRSFSLDVKNIDGFKETGTFVKMIALLPLLKRLGVTVLYLLPLSKYSLKDKKGELGSPYSVQNFTELDPLLKDNMTGDDMTLDEEFSALVEACHIMNIRVTIDIIPRTNSVNSDLIPLHPDWFYWIKASEFKKYRVPFVENIPSTTYPAPKWMPMVFQSDDVIRHIKMFMKNPKDTDLEKFNKIEAKDTTEFLEKVEKEFDLKVAPAFSDQINDIQPPWSDVTYFRLFLDDPEETKNYLKIKHNPYILSDTIKCNLYPGKKPNLALWNLLSSVVPSYISRFGIDGARIDMGHALPKDLLDLIMSKARNINPDFAFIAEELNMDNDKAALANGYNAMIGNGFWAEPRIREGEFQKFIEKTTLMALPVFAASETHDTRRTTKREGGEKLTRFLITLNYFLPNTIPFINSGEEVYEKEPMNTGVDADQTDLEALPQNDLFYHKLALFDKYAFHYTVNKSHEIINHLVDVLKEREKWLPIMNDLSNFVPLHFYEDNNALVGLSYVDKKTKKCLIILGNADMYNGYYTTATLNIMRKVAKNPSTSGKLLYGTYEFPHDFYDFNVNGDLYCFMGSGEVKIFEI